MTNTTEALKTLDRIKSQDRAITHRDDNGVEMPCDNLWAITTAEIDILKEALKSQEQEPLLITRIACPESNIQKDSQEQEPSFFGWYDNHDIYDEKQTEDSIPLWTRPAQPLSDDVINEIGRKVYGVEELDLDRKFVRAIEAKHGIGVKE